MHSEEEVFRILQEISEDFYNLGYPILNNITSPFPGFKSEEELLKDRMDEKEDSEDELFSMEL